MRVDPGIGSDARVSFVEASVPGHQTVRSVVKATQLLLRIAERDGLTAAQAAVEVGIPLPTAYHLLNTLLAEGMLSRDSTRHYRVGPKVATLAMAYTRNGPSEALLRVMRELSERTGETANLAGWRDGEVVAFATIEGTSAVRVGRIHIELRGSENARASGKLLLAHLDPDSLDAYIATHKLERRTPRTIVSERQLRKELEVIRQRGYAYDESEFLEGVGCVAAPIVQGGNCVSCVTISAPLERFQSNRDRLASAVVDAATSASDD